MLLTLRRLLLWTIVCVVSAAPSFAFARVQFDHRAMVVGICVFICIYTAISSTAAFGRLYRRPFMRRTMYIGYGMRMLLSLAVPIGMRADIFPGALSLGFVENALRIDPRTFLGTFLTTCVQGTLLNVILLIFMSMVQGFQLLFLKQPNDGRGFEVIPMATRADPQG